ncbi:hypothetical protein [Haloarchaeobius sp. DFWS5]|uniref:hypothetical protein n=1 Tax=Haloarchaeobius sp. DFWS5 TaxID=3446114 RepID=UPI003EBB2628
MNWFKVLGGLVPLGILLASVAALATMGTGLSNLTDAVALPAVAAGLVLVVVVMGAVCAVGARSKEWRSNTYW